MADVDPYRRYRPTVRNYDLPSPELARLRFEAARRDCQQLDGDDEVTIELVSGGRILDEQLAHVGERLERHHLRDRDGPGKLTVARHKHYLMVRWLSVSSVVMIRFSCGSDVWLARLSQCLA